jgi:hypothetical protein
MNMVAKEPISVTLDATNLVWLRARVGAGEVRSVSALLDRLVAEARTRGTLHEPTSVVGTIDVSSSDPLLLRADNRIRAMFRSSLERPLLVKETRAAYGTTKRSGRRRRG